MSSNHSLRLVSKAKDTGYRAGFIYVVLSSIDLHIARVKTRVVSGGHFVPDADVARRYRSSLQNLVRGLTLVDEGVIIDNSIAFTPRQLFRIDWGIVTQLPAFDSSADFDMHLLQLLSSGDWPE